MKRILLFMMLCALLAGPFGVLAQGAPEQIVDALADLSGRVGRELTLNDLYWTWEQNNYPDASLGCPQPGEVYAQVMTVGYRFRFTYEDQIYDYRVSADRNIVILCSVTPVEDEDTPEEPDPVDEDRPAYSNPLCPPPPEDITYMRTRLAVDIQARVASTLPSNLRSEPDRAAPLLGELPGGSLFQVIAGPQCDETGLLWWQIDYDGQVGWTAEGGNGDYYLEPFPGLTLPSERQPIDALNVELVAEVSRLQGNYGSVVAFASLEASRDQSWLVVPGAAGSEGVWVYDMAALDQPPRLVTSTDQLTTVSFSSRADTGMFGGMDGAVRLWDLTPGAQIMERVFLRGHDNPVSATAFSPQGERLASSGGLAYLTNEEGRMYAISLWSTATVSLDGALRGHEGTVTGLAFVSDASELVSVSRDSTLRVWDLDTQQSRLVVELAAEPEALTLSPDGVFAAVALVDGSVHLINLTGGEIVNTWPASMAEVRSVAFSSDGALLVYGDEAGGLYYALLTGADEAQDTLWEFTAAVEDIAFSPDGTVLAVLLDDHTMRIMTVLDGAVG